MSDFGTRVLEAAALLMREVVCEQVYRQRAAWDVEHPNNSLGVRTIHPHDIARAVVVDVVDLPSKQLRALAAAILNESDANAWPDVVNRFFQENT